MPSRRQTLAGIGLAAAGLVGGYATTAAQSASATLGWPMARYDAAGTGYNPDASGPKDDPRVAWAGDLERTGGLEPDPPVVVDGTVYAGTENLFALDAATGDVLFSYGNYGVSHSSPACAATSIYRTKTLAISSPGGTVGLNAGGGMALFGVHVGKQRWRGPGTEPEPSVFGPSKAPPPVTVDETVYAVAPTTSDIVALEADNGRERWRRRFPGGDISGTAFRPAVSGDTVYATGWPSDVAAFDAETGSKQWAESLDDADVNRPPTATENGVVVPTRRGVTLYEDSGDARWTRNLDGNATEGAVAVAEGRVFVSDGDESLYALDLETGADVWSVAFSHEATPVVADGVVYMTSGAELIAFDAATGERRFTRESGWYFSPPAVGDGVLYVVDGDQVLALEDEP
ncbi:PQQ-binding-like beta-propeller repeat protein [Natrinema hispanicum]|uniref:Outer membrane protein assembly factor BamB, contains PQQ-like beta-propeller repeat n=1 Tax=Natrinema hispanicum TaxID=392421 RepID=A0A1G6L8D1_9EURY|nr:PQQ-binding-like beta-propeller repeat protein [Natrinema hispanicum]SDC39622.1 Outer membrane protein assembly factor BamB, contains PQQ-like beta-propeller repeat [Natrinema hispanicum]